MNTKPTTIEELNRRFYARCRALGITPPIGESGLPPLPGVAPDTERAA